VTPFKDAIWAKAELQWMEWSTTLLGQAKQIDEAQNGKGLFGGRGPMRRVTPTSPLLTREQAQEQVLRAGVDVPVSAGIRQEALDIKIKWAKRKQDLEATVARADQGFGTQLALGATAFVVGAADPVNVATTFVPVIGEAKLAYWLAKAASRLGPTAAKVAVRAGVGAYDAGVGSIAFEPINYVAHKAVGDDYDLVDSVINVGLGAGAGSALRVLGGVGVDLYRGMRVRGYLSIDAYGRVINQGLHQLGFGRPIDVAPSLAAENGALVVPGPSEGDALHLLASASLLPLDTFLVLPGDGTDISDQVGIKAVLRELMPVTSSATEEVYRKKSGDDILVYTRTEGASGNREAFIVQRLKPGDANYDGPLSVARQVEDAEASRRASRLLYMKAPAELQSVLTNAGMAAMDKLERVHSADPLKLHPPEADGGYQVDSAVGTAIHTALSSYADRSKTLHRGWEMKRQKPDGFVSTDHAPLALEMKPESPTGISLGYQQALGYQDTFGVDATVLLYSRHMVEPRMKELNEKITKTWTDRVPAWRDLLTRSGKEKMRKAGVDSRVALSAVLVNAGSKPLPERRSRRKRETRVQKGNKERGKQP
jgi:hypothetical protein